MNEVPAKGGLQSIGPVHLSTETDLSSEQYRFAELLGRVLAEQWQCRGTAPIGPDVQQDDWSTEKR